MDPRPEYPRPQWRRDEWLCLNGEWQFEIDHADTGRERGLVERELSGAITVPFCPESELSGVGEREFMRAVWYRRDVELPPEWEGSRVLLHFGAVDYEATVWANGVELGAHTGGWSPFTVELTRAAKPGETVAVVLRARDDTRDGAQPGGKQSPRFESHGCYYTRTTGIWQTVWMEPVPQVSLERPAILPDPGAARVHCTAGIDLPAGAVADGWRVRAELLAGETPVASDEVGAARGGRGLVLQLDDTDLRRWSPADPFLYDLVLTLNDASGEVVDRAVSYCGLRSVDAEDGAFRLNGEPVFLRTVLDQGYYPDGVMTAPTDEALRRDIELSMECGFNGARLHQKVFEERFLYWADRLGYLVWGEFGDWGADRRNPRASASWVRQWVEVMRRDISHPSVIGWCPLNETHDTPHDSVRPLDELTRALFETTRAIDPTRPVLDTSGYKHVVREADVYDCHDYCQDPSEFAAHYEEFARGGDPWVNSGETTKGVAYAGQPFFVSEMGGTWWNPAAAESEDSWGYGDRPKSPEEYAERFKGLVGALLDNPRICGYCYTQLTDIEQEQNGVLYPDRRPKVDLGLLRSAQERPAAVEE